METITEAIARARPVPLPSLAMRRALREEAYMAQQDLATVVGVNRATVARWELGIREPRGEVRRRYAEALRELDRSRRGESP